MISDIYNFRLIQDAPSTSGQPSESQLHELASEGYEIIINLALHDDPRYSLPDEQGLVESLGMIYVHIPVQFDAPSDDNLLRFFQAMEKYKDKKMHVHCAANMRVTAFLGLYRMLMQGKSEDVAFEPMRTIWEPNGVWSAFISESIAKFTNTSHL